ncbi:hypothetical protein SAMN05216436_12153 [bacterium A37T11]|nr:hypothetical protein SAMN05216436_12153 [bacterium A37T11]
MKNTSLLRIIAVSIIFSGCASGYKTLMPEQMSYLSGGAKDGISIDYKYGVLDKKYAKKEAKNFVKLVSVKLINQTDKDLVFGQNIKLRYSGGSEATLMNMDEVYRSLRQHPATYLWYLALTPLNLYVNKSESNSSGYSQSKTSTTPIGLILGPGIAGGNMIAASNANKKFRADLEMYNLIGRSIKKGETVYGLVGIRSGTYEALNATINP